MRDVCPCSVPLRMWPIRLAANCLWKFNGLGSCVVAAWRSMAGSCPGTLCMAMARTLHACVPSARCAWLAHCMILHAAQASQARLSFLLKQPAVIYFSVLELFCIFLLIICIIPVHWYPQTTMVASIRFDDRSQHKVAMHASSGLMAGCVVRCALSWCVSLWIGRSRRHTCAAPSLLTLYRRDGGESICRLAHNRLTHLRVLNSIPRPHHTSATATQTLHLTHTNTPRHP